MSNTKDDLKEAFAGESQANQKYRAFAKKAEQDGFPNIARLFRTTAEAEKIHAEGHINALEGVKSTMENLEAAIGGETYEYTEMYPPMLKQAEAEGHKGKRMIGYALQVEQVHARLYKLALDAVKNGADLTRRVRKAKGAMLRLRSETGKVCAGGIGAKVFLMLCFLRCRYDPPGRS